MRYETQEELTALHAGLMEYLDNLDWNQANIRMQDVIQIIKLRGQAPKPGIHTFRTTADGIRVFPRTFNPPQNPERPGEGERLSTGVPGLDALMGGGVPTG